MVHTTVLVPQRNAGAELATRIPRLCQKLATIGRPFEVIVIDDASSFFRSHFWLTKYVNFAFATEFYSVVIRS